MYERCNELINLPEYVMLSGTPRIRLHQLDAIQCVAAIPRSSDAYLAAIVSVTRLPRPDSCRTQCKAWACSVLRLQDGATDFQQSVAGMQHGVEFVQL